MDWPKACSKPKIMRSAPFPQTSDGCALSPLLDPASSPLDAALSCAKNLRQARNALDHYLGDPSSIGSWLDWMEAIRAAAAAVASEPRRQDSPPWWEDASALILAILGTGVHERLAAEDTEPVPCAKSRHGLIARMLLRPAWEGSFPPDLDSAPEWMRETFGKWLFAPVGLFSASGQVDGYARYRERLLGDLTRWAAANPGSAVVQFALRLNQDQEDAFALRMSAGDLRKHFETVAHLAARGNRASISADLPVTAFARAGRRLRVAILLPTLDGSAETLAAIPLCTQLDPERFETLVYLERSSGTQWERQCRQVSGNLSLLPDEHSDRLLALSSAGLDVIVLAADLTNAGSGIGRLAQHRLAPLQVITGGQNWVSSGRANIDLFVSGALTGMADSASEFTERLGVMAGPSRVFDDSLVPVAGGTLTRAEAGLPETEVLLAAAADWREILPGTMNEWARLLAAAPGTSLLLQRAGTGPAGFDREFRAAFDRVLGEHGVDGNRLIISPTALPNPADLQALLALSDLFLDVQPSLDETAALLALKAGVPVVTVEGTSFRSRRVAALLRSLGLDDFVAQTEKGYAAIALRLVSRVELRKELSGRIETVMATGPLALDPLAAGDAFGDLLELSFDELIAGGAARFAVQKRPLLLPSDPVSTGVHVASGMVAIDQRNFHLAAAEARAALRSEPMNNPARAVLGAALLELGQTERAVDYLLAVVGSPNASARVWYDLAVALRKSGRGGDVVQALEASLRLDPEPAAGWLMLADLAAESGAPELARDALAILKEKHPQNPLLPALVSRLEA